MTKVELETYLESEATVEDQVRNLTLIRNCCFAQMDRLYETVARATDYLDFQATFKLYDWHWYHAAVGEWISKINRLYQVAADEAELCQIGLDRLTFSYPSL